LRFQGSSVTSESGEAAAVSAETYVPGTGSTASEGETPTVSSELRFQGTIAAAEVEAATVVAELRFRGSVVTAEAGEAVAVDGLIGILVITRRFLVNALARLRTFLAARVSVVNAVLRLRTVIPDEDSMSELPTFSPKRTAEVDSFSVDFFNQLGLGETLNTPTVSIAQSSESAVTDAAPLDLTVSGGAGVNGTTVVQKLQGGLSGCLYVVTFRVNTSGGRTIEQAVRLLVKDETA
jgi:hypothetical protein